MLQISKNSWHYWLWKLGRDSSSKPKNLCKYFWHIAIVKVLIPLTLALGFLLGVGALIWLIWGHPVQTALIVLTIAACALFGLGLYKFLQVWSARRQKARIAARFNPPQPPKEPGIVRSFLKARKQKMCPLIEVVDD